MNWIKQGLIGNVVSKISWANSHAQVPTLLLKEDRIRVYFATRPRQNLSLTTYCDLDRNDPTKVLYVHDKPLLELGEPGTFDQHGIMPASVVEKDGLVYLYYSGWSQSVGVPYSNYTGVAISEDGGNTFSKPYKGPVLDRTKEELFSATSPEVIYDGKWHIWYCSGTNWHEVNGKFEHSYDIKYAASDDGINWKQNNRVAIAKKDMYEAITRPSLLKMDEGFYMYYCYRGTFDFRKGNDAYKIGCAYSKDMMNWERRDDKAGITRSEQGWDSEMIAYPAVIKSGHDIYLFYNGNDFGKEGFGFAKLIT